MFARGALCRYVTKSAFSMVQTILAAHVRVSALQSVNWSSPGDPIHAHHELAGTTAHLGSEASGKSHS